MSDRYYASIRIGGDLPRSQVAGFCRLLGLDHESDVALLQHIEDGRLVHCDDQAAWGEFCELESACRDLDLPYVRRSEGYWDCPPQAVFWQPGMEGPESTVTDSDGNPLVSMDTLCEVRAALRSGRMAEALALLDETIIVVPETPPFRIL